MRSKFKDEHPFGMWRVLADVRSKLIRRPTVQTSARRRLSVSGRSILTGYPYVVALSDVCRSLIDGMLHNAVPHIPYHRSFARRRTRRTFLLSTRRSTWCHQCVDSSLLCYGGRAELSRCRILRWASSCTLSGSASSSRQRRRSSSSSTRSCLRQQR